MFVFDWASKSEEKFREFWTVELNLLGILDLSCTFIEESQGFSPSNPLIKYPGAMCFPFVPEVSNDPLKLRLIPSPILALPSLPYTLWILGSSPPFFYPLLVKMSLLASIYSYCLSATPLTFLNYCCYRLLLWLWVLIAVFRISTSILLYFVLLFHPLQFFSSCAILGCFGATSKKWCP